MRVELFRHDVALDHTIKASGQEHAGRSRLFLRLEHEGIAGYGEVDPQPRELNGDPGLDEVVGATARLVERLHEVLEREGALPEWVRAARLTDARPSSNAAAALVEMALVDREMRRDARRVEEWWIARYDTPSQATVSLLDDSPWRVEGAGRIRVKSAPGAVSRAGLDRLGALAQPVIVDFNCSASRDAEVIDQLAELVRVADVVAIEQPYGVGNLVDHARLAAVIRGEFGVAMSLDESIRSLRDLHHVTQHAAASMICVKPARVGGLANARTIFERARDAGLRAYLGGFFESPYARRVHRALARHVTDEPSDVGEVALAAGAALETSALPVSFGLEPSASMLALAQRLSDFAWLAT